jgi:RND family efflux transporter MFP subunit
MLIFLNSAFIVKAQTSSYGYTEPYRSIEMSAAEPGVLSQIAVEEGAVVKEGQLLAQMDVRVLEAELKIAEAQFTMREQRTEKLTELDKKGSVSRDEMQRARADLEIDRQKLERTRAMIERNTLRSPVNGIITLIKKEVSESVTQANPHVLTVVQIDKLRVNLFLRAEQARLLIAGAVTDLCLLDTKKKITGRVEFVSPITDAASGTTRVKFVIDNAAGQIKSGERCTLWSETQKDAEKKAAASVEAPGVKP